MLDFVVLPVADRSAANSRADRFARSLLLTGRSTAGCRLPGPHRWWSACTVRPTLAPRQPILRTHNAEPVSARKQHVFSVLSADRAPFTLLERLLPRRFCVLLRLLLSLQLGQWLTVVDRSNQRQARGRQCFPESSLTELVRRTLPPLFELRRRCLHRRFTTCFSIPVSFLLMLGRSPNRLIAVFAALLASFRLSFGRPPHLSPVSRFALPASVR